MQELTAYGLEDARVLEVATQIAPELFAALEIAERLEDERFPLESDADIEAIIAEAAGEGGAYDSPGIRITPSVARDRFPDGFLPVTDRFDLIRKAYMAIVIAHESESRERIEAARAAGGVEASHPFDLELL